MKLIKKILDVCPKWVIVVYLVNLWINIGLFIISLFARRPRSFSPGTEATDWFFPFEYVSWQFENGKMTKTVISTSIEAYDWTELLFYSLLPLFCIITCLLVIEMIDRRKSKL